MQRSLWSPKWPNTVHDYLATAFMAYEPRYGLNLPDVLRRYQVGCTRSEAAIFWYITKTQKVVEGRVVDITPEGEQIEREPVSARMGQLKPQGLPIYGEHLLWGQKGEVFVVADELTALFMACVMPDMIWLACPTAELPDNAERSLARRKVYLCNGGDIGTWRRYLTQSEVEVLDIVPEGMPTYEESVRGRAETMAQRMVEMETAIRETLRDTAHERMMAESEGYRMLVERLNCHPISAGMEVRVKKKSERKRGRYEKNEGEGVCCVREGVYTEGTEPEAVRMLRVQAGLRKGG